MLMNMFDAYDMVHGDDDGAWCSMWYVGACLRRNGASVNTHTHTHTHTHKLYLVR